MREQLLTIILGLYPTKWRERYADEFLAMLELCELSLSDYLDMTLSAVEFRFKDMKGYLMKDLLNRLTGLIALLSAIGFLSALFITDEGTAEFMLIVSPMLSVLLIPAIYRATRLYYPKASLSVMLIGMGAIGLFIFSVILNNTTDSTPIYLMVSSAVGLVMIGLWMILVNVLALQSKVMQPALAIIGVIVGITWIVVMGVTMYTSITGTRLLDIQAFNFIYGICLISLMVGYVLWSVSVGLVFLTGQNSRQLQLTYA